jgi:uncharacterized membrane protein YdbT with pleckstrin-like domain
MNNSLYDNRKDGHVLHQSVTALFIRGIIIWIVAFIIFIVSEFLIGNVFNFFSTAQSQTTTAVQMSIGALPVATLLHVLLFLFYGISAIYLILSWFYNYHILKSKHIIVKKGIIFSDEENFDMEELQSVKVHQGLFGKIFNYGTVELHDAEINKRIILKNVTDPYQEADYIEKMYPEVTPSRMRGVMK